MATQLKARALLVGIADYKHVTPLPFSVRDDINDVATLLKDPAICGYNEGAVEILVDYGASLEELRRSLQKASSTLQPDEVFLFYFSGHGHREGDKSYLMACDSRLDDVEQTALSEAELHSLLGALPCERQVILLDACHAGGMGSLKSSGNNSTPLGIAKGSIDLLSKGRGKVVLASCRPDEVSWILQGWRNSLFTDVVLKALKGQAQDKGDGTVGVFDLFSFVASEVPKHANQHPIFKADQLEENFSVALHPQRSKKQATAALPSVSEGDLTRLLANLYPLGPTQSDVWSRAGGDLSRLQLNGHGLAQWHAALQTVQRGGGGLKLADLMATVLQDFPGNDQVAGFR